jgi:hypothetical protein
VCLRRVLFRLLTGEDILEDNVLSRSDCEKIAGKKHTLEV